MGRLGAAGGLLLQEERGGKVLGEGEGVEKHARQNIISHAPMIPKPPKARTHSTTRHQQSQLSQQLPPIPKPQKAADSVCVCARFYLGIPGGSAGGTRAGLEGTRGTELGSGPGRDGTGGAPNAGEGLRGVGGPGVGPLTAGGRLGGGAVAEAARDPGGGLRPRDGTELHFKISPLF